MKVRKLVEPPMPSIKDPAALHWHLFAWNGAYFLISLPLVALWWIIRKSWYMSQGKNFWGETREEELKQKTKEDLPWWEDPEIFE